VKAVRLDSGDLGRLAIETRRMLDEAGLRSVKIFASSGLDEYKIQRLVASGAPIDGFGVGTSLAVSEDAPALDMAYKLVEYAGKGRLKLSTRKVLYPGRKQVFRQFENGRIVRDVIARFDESLEGKPLLKRIFQTGQPCRHPTLTESRQLLQDQLERMPAQCLELSRPEPPYPVLFSDRLQADLAMRRSGIMAEHLRI
jgi:nicotinate phosphoribosyltransferase